MPVLLFGRIFTLLSYFLDKFAAKMPKIKTNRVKYPEGWELIEPTLRELQAKMREGLSIFHYHVFVNIFVVLH